MHMRGSFFMPFSLKGHHTHHVGFMLPVLNFQKISGGNLWPDSRKGVFHTHPISWTCGTITLLSEDMWSWNFLQPITYVGTSCLPNFKSSAFTNLKLEIVKVSKLDVCGRPLSQIQSHFEKLTLWDWIWTEICNVN